MIKKWLNLLSRYPRLRVLLVVIVAIVVLVALVNMLSGKSQPAKQGMAPPSQIVSGRVNPNQARTVGTALAVDQAATTVPAAPVATPPPAPVTPPNQSGFFSGLFDSKAPAPPALNQNQASAVVPAVTGQSSDLAVANTAYVNNRSTSEVKASAPVSQPLTASQIEMAKQLSSSMQSSLSGSTGQWSLPTQQTVVGSGPSANSAGTGVGPGGIQGPISLKAGSILFAVLDVGLNSDQPGTPVLAEIAAGKYNGAKLMGTFTLEGEKLVVKFTMMSMPKWPSTVAINAYGIDPDTGANALASDVNNHYLVRYGSLLAAGFLQGYGNAYTTASTSSGCISAPGLPPCVITTSSNGTVPVPTAKSAMFQGLGQVGTNLGTAAANNFNMPPTVTLDQGSGMGILFMQDTTLPKV